MTDPGTLSIRALLVAIAALACLATVAPRAGAAPSFTSSNGLTVQAVQRLDTRTFDVTLTSTVIDGPLHVRVILPDGYDQQPAARYPVLYLFHGTSGGASDWTDKGAAEQTTAGHDLITVIPDAAVSFSGGGWCTNWYNRGAGGKPMWETFHIDQLIPWVDQTLRTRATRAGRQIFGLSQGGFCAYSYAARHPDTFLGAGSFSGAIDTARDPAAQALTTPVIQATATALDGGSDPDAIFGPRATQEINWAAHDPATLVENLGAMSLYAYTGNGQPGPLDSPVPNPAGSAIEAGVHALTSMWKDAADAAGVPVSYHDYGPGTHSWPYWARDLREVIDQVSATFASPPAPPAQKLYTSADDPWSQWGYDVSIARPAREFSTLSHGDRSGFTLAGSGVGTVVTPPAYRPGSRLVIALHGHDLNRTLTERADRAGRLHIAIPLGPGNPYQQSTAQSDASGGNAVYTTHVLIAGTHARRHRGGGSRRCGSRRSITFSGLAPHGWRIIFAKATVRGHRLVTRHSRRTVTVNLGRAHTARYRIALTLRISRSTDGDHSLDIHRQRTITDCATRRR